MRVLQGSPLRPVSHTGLIARRFASPACGAGEVSPAATGRVRSAIGSIVGSSCGVAERPGSFWRQRGRELAGKRRVRFIALRAPADFRELPRSELPDRSVAAVGEAAFIFFDRLEAKERLKIVA